MQDDRDSNVAGQDPAGAGAPERAERTERERDLAAKSLRGREEGGAPAGGEERGGGDRGPEEG
ncbi:MAG TPA: hypothetical protein VF746_31220 [Longimicrobium sp.]|jgi:hypothetical protein